MTTNMLIEQIFQWIVMTGVILIARAIALIATDFIYDNEITWLKFKPFSCVDCLSFWLAIPLLFIATDFQAAPAIFLPLIVYIARNYDAAGF